MGTSSHQPCLCQPIKHAQRSQWRMAGVLWYMSTQRSGGDTGVDTKPCCGPGANRLVSSRTRVANMVTAAIWVRGEIRTSLVVKWDCEVLTGSDKDLGGKEMGYFAYPFKGSYSIKQLTLNSRSVMFLI